MTFHEPPTDEILKLTLDTLLKFGGNKSAAARELGWPRKTLSDRVSEAEVRFGVKIGRLADGRIGELPTGTRPLPPEGHIKRYVFTSVQNNTHLHPGWTNLKAYVDWLDKLPNAAAEFIVGTFSYAIDAYGAKAVKRGTWKPDSSEPWYANEVQDFIVDERLEIAPALVWCGEMNIQPTAVHPLTGLETYNGRKSNIVPHVKVALESVPSMPNEGTKFNYSTGTITQRNYIQKKAGIVAEAMHGYGGLLVEVNHLGEWWCRQLHLDAEGRVCDVGPSGYSPVEVVDGVVHEGKPIVEAITWGDVHTAELEPWVRNLAWGPEGMLDTVRPRKQIAHDIYSHRSRSHHEMKDFHALYLKQRQGRDSVEAEVQQCADLLVEASRPWCDLIVVPSNHDRHLTRWLNEEDPRKDLPNARYHNRLQASLLEALDRGEYGFNVLEYALREKGAPAAVEFLKMDESFVICREVGGGIESALHGDLGPGGSRGSTKGLTRLGRAVIKGHDHRATIMGNVYSVGACSLDFAFMHGPSAHSITHCVTFDNATRQLVTMWRGKWRA